MGDYRKVFAKRHTFLTVIHTDNHWQVIENVAISKDNGADGAFLINHVKPAHLLIEIYAKAREKFPNYWIGLNALDLTPTELLKRTPKELLRSLNGVWSDNIGLASGLAENFRHYCENEIGWHGLYFGGVAFKHQHDFTNDPQKAAYTALKALSFVDVITTSGAATGTPPPVEKIKAMKREIDDTPLAIASGLTPENVGSYLPFADCFLVATGVSDSFTQLNPYKVRAFHDRCDNYCTRPR